MTDKDTLLAAVREQAKEWADIYQRAPNGATSLRAMLLGIENGIQRRLGGLPEARRVCPSGVEIGPFTVGLSLANQIPASILRPFEKSLAADVLED